jgi:hypothetical protein
MKGPILASVPLIKDVKSPSGRLRNRLGAATPFHPLALFLILLFIATATILMGNPFWMTNDNAQMAWIASGQFTGVPSGRLTYISQFLGWPIAGLYQLFPNFSWLPILILGSSILSFALLSRLARDVWMWIAIYVISAPLLIHTALRPNFTVVAFLAAAVGVALFASSIRRPQIPILGFITVLLGAFWRVDAVFLTLFVLSPILIIAIMDSPKSIKFRNLLITVGLGVSVVFFNRVGMLCWGGVNCQEWTDYLKFNQIRSSFQTRPRGEIAAQVGGIGDWTSTQINLFMNFSFPDDELFGLSRLNELHEGFPMLFKLYGYDLPGHFSFIWQEISPLKVMVLALILAVFIPGILLRQQKGKLSLHVALLLLTVVGGLLATSVVTLTLANILGLFAALFVGLVTLASWHPLKKITRLPFAIATASVALSIGLVVFSILMGPISIAKLNAYAADQWIRHSFFQSQFVEIAADAAVFGQGNIGDYFVLNPYSERVGNQGPQALLSGWSVFSPEFDQRKSNIGFDNVLEDLRLGRTESGKKTYFSGSATNALLIADVINQQEPGHEVQPINRGQLTLPGDTLIGDVALWSYELQESQG